MNSHHVHDVLTHELIHVYDDCRANVDWDNLQHVACSEIRAASLSGECYFSKETFGRLRFGWRKHHQVSYHGFAHMFTSVCSHVRICVFTCVYLCVFTCENLCVHMCVSVCSHVCICVFTCVYLCVHMCVSVCSHVCICVFTCVYLCVHTCISVCSHVCMCVFTCVYVMCIL